MAKPGADPHTRLAAEDALLDALGHLITIVGRKDEGVEIQSIVAHEGRDKGPRGGSNDDIGLVGVPSGRQFDRHESRHLIGGAGDSTAT